RDGVSDRGGAPGAGPVPRRPGPPPGPVSTRGRTSMPRTGTAADPGLTAGAPPFPPRALVTLANWQDPPFNRWAFQHVRDLIPTARIRRGHGPVWRLPSAARDLSGIRFHDGARELTVGELLERT